MMNVCIRWPAAPNRKSATLLFWLFSTIFCADCSIPALHKFTKKCADSAIRSKKETGEADSATDAALQAEKFVREFQKSTGSWLHGIR